MQSRAHHLDEAVAPSVHDAERLLLDWAVAASDEVSAAAFRRAARALFQSVGGRPPLDDRPLLKRVAQLMAKGMPAWAACDRVASLTPGAKRHSLTARLYGKVINSDKKHSGNGFSE